MSFPVEIEFEILSPSDCDVRKIKIYSGLTVIIGPNGSGKTQLMRGMRKSCQHKFGDKMVSFISAGRMGELENYRSDCNGRFGGNLKYDEANYGEKMELKNRHRAESLRGGFQTLVARQDILIKIRERLRKLFKRDLQITWDSGSIKVFFVHKNGSLYSSGREASGLIHLVGLLAMIYDDEVGVLFIDEPEVSLHPQLQSFLLQEILSVSGWPEKGSNKKVIIISTHSTEFINFRKPADLSNILFTSSIYEDPIQIPPEADELKGQRISALLRAMGREHRLALFASSPLLVEGPSDAIIAASVASRLDVHLDAGGSQLLPVIGKGQLPVVCKLFRLMGKNPVILADADTLADGLELVNSVLITERSNLAASAHGFSSATELANQVYSSFCQLVDNNWPAIEGEASKHPYWGERKKSSGVSDCTAKRRAAFSTLFMLTDEELRALGHKNQWLSMKVRLVALLDLLECEGCFILRKGTIESYFIFESEDDKLSKLEAASTEAAAIIDADCARVESAYKEVARCLNYASTAERIVEAEALQEVLLAICAPAVAKLRAGRDVSNINTDARSVAPELADLFDLKVLNGKLQVSLNSRILDVSGFPITIDGRDDVLTVIARALSLE